MSLKRDKVLWKHIDWEGEFWLRAIRKGFSEEMTHSGIDDASAPIDRDSEVILGTWPSGLWSRGFKHVHQPGLELTCSSPLAAPPLDALYCCHPPEDRGSLWTSWFLLETWDHTRYYWGLIQAPVTRALWSGPCSPRFCEVTDLILLKKSWSPVILRGPFGI